MLLHEISLYTYILICCMKNRGNKINKISSELANLHLRRFTCIEKCLFQILFLYGFISFFGGRGRGGCFLDFAGFCFRDFKKNLN